MDDRVDQSQLHATPTGLSKKMSYAEVIVNEERGEIIAGENFKALIAVLSEMMTDGEALSLAYRLHASVEEQIFQDQSNG